MEDWKVCTSTMTEGEIVEWYVDGDEIVVASNLAKNAIYLSERQAENMITGLSYQLNLLRKARNRG